MKQTVYIFFHGLNILINSRILFTHLLLQPNLRNFKLWPFKSDYLYLINYLPKIALTILCPFGTCFTFQVALLIKTQ